MRTCSRNAVHDIVVSPQFWELIFSGLPFSCAHLNCMADDETLKDS